MTPPLARRAVVVGAGMGGLSAAGALARHFEEVVVLDRDTLPDDGSQRAGIPQGRHVHALLAGGRRALSELFSDLEDALMANGAVRLQVDVDVLRESPGAPNFPRRDLGFYSYALSRPRLEATVRDQVRALDNVRLEDRCRVQSFRSGDGGRNVNGVVYTGPDDGTEAIEAELVVDASGRGRLTLDFLEEHGHPLPEATTIGVDRCYSSAVFEIPDDASTDWKGVFALEVPPAETGGGLLLPLEEERWIVSLGGSLSHQPPGDPDGFMAYARDLPAQTVYSAIAGARRVGDVARFQFPESIRRHFARLPSFPGGLLPIADTLCRFNPIYGQGMSVAAQEALKLERLLSARAGESKPLEGLAPALFEAVEEVIDTPWMTSALPDFLYPKTRGQRPPDFERRIQRAGAVNRLAMTDPEVHQVLFEVRHLLKPSSALGEPWLTERIAEASAQA